MQCPNCGADLENLQSDYCPKCGLRVKEPSPVITKKPKERIKLSTVALILALVLFICGGIYLIFTQFIIPRFNAPGAAPMPVAPSYPAEDTFSYVETMSPDEETAQYRFLFNMPNYIGADYFIATSDMGNAGVEFELTYEYNNEYEEGIIFAQSIDVGEPVYADAYLVLCVSKGPDSAPEGYDQKLTLTAPAGSSYGTLTLYDWYNGQWNETFRCQASLGINGIGYDYGEGRKITPRGTFKMGVVLSAQSIYNDTIPFVWATEDVCVVDDPNSYMYNTIQYVSSLPDGVSYDSIGSTIANGSYNACIYIEHNGDGLSSDNVVPGRGSVITICGKLSSLNPTLGCVDIAYYDMDTLLTMLNYNKNTHIEIDVQ